MEQEKWPEEYFCSFTALQLMALEQQICKLAKKAGKEVAEIRKWTVYQLENKKMSFAKILSLKVIPYF